MEKSSQREKLESFKIWNESPRVVGLLSQNGVWCLQLRTQVTLNQSTRGRCRELVSISWILRAEEAEGFRQEAR